MWSSQFLKNAINQASSLAAQGLEEGAKFLENLDDVVAPRLDKEHDDENYEGEWLVISSQCASSERP